LSWPRPPDNAQPACRLTTMPFCEFSSRFRFRDRTYCRLYILWYPSSLPRGWSRPTWGCSRPRGGLSSKWSTCEIKNDEGHVRILQIAGDEALEALLPRCVPELQPDYLTTRRDILADEVYSYCRLSHLTFTFLVGSNSLRIYLAMIELFPTFWSPTRTILNFWMELRLLEKLILSLIIIKQIIKQIKSPGLSSAFPNKLFFILLAL
jgi:hypothetical protein